MTERPIRTFKWPAEMSTLCLGKCFTLDLLNPFMPFLLSAGQGSLSVKQEN